jgi:ketosteroid isomerase-like protein
MKKEEKGEKEEEANVIAVNQLYNAFRRPDISSLLDMFTDDAVIHGPAPAGVLSWGGVHYGRKGAAEFFMAVGESLEVRQFELRYIPRQQGCSAWTSKGESQA